MALLRAKKPKELKSKDVKWSCDLKIFDFESTSTVKPIQGIVGQERALKALKMGVDLRSPGYNVFVTGLSGTGKLTTIKNMLENIRPQCPELFDYMYVNNFKSSDKPILITLPAGEGKHFKIDFAGTIKFLRQQIPQELETEDFSIKKKELIEMFGSRQNSIMAEFEKRLAKDNFTIGSVKAGSSEKPDILPIIEDKASFIQQLDDFVRAKIITKQKAKNITKKYSEYKQEMNQIIKKTMIINKEFQEELEEIEIEAVSLVIKGALDNLRDKYHDEKVHLYLEKVEDSIFENLEAFKTRVAVRSQQEAEYVEAYMSDYEVNLIMDNSDSDDCPVVIETTPTYSNLFGTIEKVYDGQGGWHADYSKIKAGAILQANGGYLVINAMAAFDEPAVWKTLKSVLLHGKLELRDISSFYNYSPSSMKPEAIKINTKIILIGNNEIYNLLSSHENDFNKIFKVKAEFDYEMKLTDRALKEYAQVIKKLVQNESLMEFDKCAIAKITEYGARYAGKQNKLTTRFAYIADLVREASFVAKDNGNEIVTDIHVKQAYENQKERHGLYESKLNENFKEGTFLIDTDGKRVGQINGLAVYGNGVYDFGKPTRITASVSLGNGSIINVEREAGLSGKTHNKGMLIITGYFRETFGKKVPLSFNASIVFEQGYGMIDGDSASITEICALLSCLSDIPIRQDLAITGSVNQKGDIQPIGGVNEKIEGFYDICKSLGFNKKQGVIIPVQNVKELMLKDEVVEAVRKGEFHIYPVSRVEEAIELLTGIRAGRVLKSGKFQANTIFGEVEKVLREFKRRLTPPNRNIGTKANAKKTTRKTSKKK